MGGSGGGEGSGRLGGAKHVADRGRPAGWWGEDVQVARGGVGRRGGFREAGGRPAGGVAVGLVGASGTIGAMSTPDPQSPVPDASRPESKDRIYRSPAGIAGGALLLLIAGWLGVDALVSGHGRTPWLALAALILVVPLVSAFTLRPAVFANEDRLRVRNPFRVIVLPWAQVASLRSGYSNEVVAASGTKYQLWAVPVSLRARKKVTKQQARAAGGGDGRRPGSARRPSPMGLGRSHQPVAPTRATTDQIMDDLRQLAEARADERSAQGEVTVRWAYEVMGPAIAGAALLVILLATG